MKKLLFLPKGYVAIVTVLTISAVALVIAVTVSLLAIGEAQSSLASFKGEDTLAFVDGCMEDALFKVNASANYPGGTITRPEGTCTITIVSKVGNVWTVLATTTATNYKRTLQVVVTRSTTLTLTSWREM